MLFGGACSGHLDMPPMLGHAVVAHGHVAGQQTLHLCVQIARLDADHVRELVPHLVHHVMGHVAMHRPVAGLVGDELDGPRLPNGDQHGRLELLRRLGDLSAVGLRHAKLIAVQVDRVMVHRGDIRDPDAHALVRAAPPSASVPGNAFALKVRMLKSVISFGFGREAPTSIRHSGSMNAKSRSGRSSCGLPRVDDEQAHRTERHLRHLVVVRVIHVRAVLTERELVAERLARLDNVLGEAADAVHAVRQQEAVPVDGRAAGQPVGHVDADAIAFDRFDRRTVDAAVVAPALRLEAGRELVLHLLGDKVKDLHAVHDLPRQRDIVGRDDWRVVLPWLTGWQDWLRVNAVKDRRVRSLHGCGLTRVIVLVRDVLGGVDITKEDRAAAKRSGSGKEPAAVNAKWSNLFFHGSDFLFVCPITGESGTGSVAPAQELAQPGWAPSVADVQQG